MHCLSFFSFFSSFVLVSMIKLSFAADSISAGQSITDGQTLVSHFRSFELGFFSPVNSKNRYVGIWYVSSPNTVVWVANRNSPITDKNGNLTLSNNGDLVLLNQEKSVIWSSNSSSSSENPVAQLLDSGNLVLRDKMITSSENYLWQSFDYPSDTLLPGMKLGWNLKTRFERYLTAWKSADDPLPGDVKFRLDMSRLPQTILLTGSKIEARSGIWNGQQFDGGPISHNNSIFIMMLVDTEDELYYMFKPFSDKIITRLVVIQSGKFNRFVWNETSNEWKILYTWPFDLCDSYGKCGANGNCRIDKSPTCECLKGFISKSQDEWDSPESRKCVKKPSDCPSGEGFLKLPQMKLPEVDWWNKSMNLQECEAECTKNCSCRAYANIYITGGGSGCLMWFRDLIDVRECSGQYKWGRDIFIRVPASELESVDSSNTKQRLTIIVVVSTISVMLVFGFLLCIARKKTGKRGNKFMKKTEKRGLESWKEDIEVPLYDIATIATATNNFSEANVIGKGGFGPVYKGILSTGQEIAVKRLSNNSGQGLEEFMNEVVLIGKLQHRNLVGLVGTCIQAEERILIYEYMPHKSLDYFIFGHKSGLLPWKKRFDIILGIARGLLYLHQDSKLQIVHRDLKASNILLDGELNPKISDFGLARIVEGDDNKGNTKRVVGTYGYMSPEYATNGTFSLKSDVFSLGVLLLEIVSGKRNRGFRHPSHDHNLLGHAWLLWNDGRALEVMDAWLAEHCIESQVLRCIQVSLLCVQKLPNDRLDISSVVFMLANEEVALPQPRQPGFFSESDVTADLALNKQKYDSESALTITMEEGR